MIANDYGVDFERIRHAITYEYPRAMDMPGAGFAAGPCLLKDTMQLAAFHQNDFTLGHAAMMVNEGLPSYLVRRVEARRDLKGATVGILGMAFKGESDDTRSSLAYKLRRILRFKAANVLCTDPYVTVDPSLVRVEEVLEASDVLFIGAPHQAYKDLELADRTSSTSGTCSVEVSLLEPPGVGCHTRHGKRAKGSPTSCSASWKASSCRARSSSSSMTRTTRPWPC